MKRSRIHMETNAAGETEISIFGPIGDMILWGDEVIPQMVQDALDQIGVGQPIRVLINSPGGSLPAGMTIYNLLAKRRASVVVEVLGWAVSAASVIALAGRELIMGTGAWLMIHEPVSGGWFTKTQHEKEAVVLGTMIGELADLYASRSDLSKDEVLAAMAQETWYNSESALDAGFATSVSEDAEAVALSNVARFNYKHVPSGLGTAASDKDREVPRTAAGLEKLLRESGYSRSEATGIAARGAKALLPERESREGPKVADPAGSEIESSQAEDEAILLRSRSVGAQITISGRRT